MNKPLPKGKNKKIIGIMKDELVGKIIEEFVWLRGKTFTYLIDNSSEYEKSKSPKKCAIKRKVKFED